MKIRILLQIENESALFKFAYELTQNTQTVISPSCLIPIKQAQSTNVFGTIQALVYANQAKTKVKEHK
jgi:hypothetical protein